MAKYIDAIELAEKIKNEPSRVDKFTQYDRYDGAAWRQFEILDMIKEMPAADVAPVVHGRWIGRPLCGNANCRCSECRSCFNIHANLGGKTMQKYCPNCGAKMDGGKNNKP